MAIWTATVDLPTAFGREPFLRSDLETAWLIHQDHDVEIVGGLRTAETARILHHGYGWDQSKAISYAQAAAAWNGED